MTQYVSKHAMFLEFAQAMGGTDNLNKKNLFEQELLIVRKPILQIKDVNFFQKAAKIGPLIIS